MDSTELINSLILICIMLLMSAFFSGMEIAFLSKNRLREEIDRKQNHMFDFIAQLFERIPDASESVEYEKQKQTKADRTKTGEHAVEIALFLRVYHRSHLLSFSYFNVSITDRASAFMNDL